MFKGYEEILVTVIIGVVLILCLVIIFILSIVRYKQRIARDLKEKENMMKRYEQELLQSKLETQEQTFQQIGKELHDNVGQLLSSSRMLLGLTERSMENPPDTLLSANATLGEAIGELRSLSKSLDKEWLEQFSFADNLQTEINRINSGNKVKASCTHLDKIKLKPDEQIILFRIVQEAIQNAIKHANPSALAISTTQKENGVCILVTDNGSGFEMKANGNGMGLNNMKHRTALLGGTIEWEKSEDRGTTVLINIPQQTNLT